jgi:hypothetical protein
MFQWSKKVVKPVTFEPGVADESLLELVESHLEKDPEKTFSDLCKEALWQHLCVPESVRPSSKTPVIPTPVIPGVEQQIAELRSQFADLEERFFAKESNRLETMERQLMQLSQQVAQLAIMVNQASTIQSSLPSTPARGVINSTPTPTHTPTSNAATGSQDVDPLISRLSQFLDDF